MTSLGSDVDEQDVDRPCSTVTASTPEDATSERVNIATESKTTQGTATPDTSVSKSARSSVFPARRPGDSTSIR